ncbi:Serine O-succinyltransferase [Hypoxylon texense]
MTSIKLFAVGNTKAQQARHMTQQNQRIAFLGLKSKKWLGRPARPEDSLQYESLLEQGRLYLQWLDTIEMTPEIRDQRGMVTFLERMLDDARLCFPEDMVASAIELRDKWEAENWGSNAVVEEDPTDPSMSLDSEELVPDATVAPSAEGVPAVPAAPIVRGQLPPPDHPIYGEHGIMRGIMIVRGSSGQRIYRLNPRIPKRSPKVFGHNGIDPGTWFANQLVALHRGAHGSRMGGISGNTELGAYSIVVSSNYEDLDRDKGETLYYSGSNSHANTNPMTPAPSAPGTRALKASMLAGNSVRVLRSGGARNSSRANPWLPDCGLRYDGLYRVVALREGKNRKADNEDSQIGGLYEQFVLQREPGQPPLEELQRTSPTMAQRRDLTASQQGY